MAKRVKFVLLHGFSGSPESFHELRRSLARVLGPELTMTLEAPALIGHASEASTLPISTGGFEAEVQRLLATLPDGMNDEMNDGMNDGMNDPIHLVGYSLGGRLALGMALTAPSRFRSLTLISAHPGLDSNAAREERRQSDEAWAKLLETQGIGPFVQAWQTQALFQTQRELNADALAEQRRIRLRHEPRALAAALRQLSLSCMPNYAEHLSELRLPVDWITGEHDLKFTAIAQSMLKLLPHAQHHTAPAVGHNVVLEAPDWLGRLLSVRAVDLA